MPACFRRGCFCDLRAGGSRRDVTPSHPRTPLRLGVRGGVSTRSPCRTSLAPVSHLEDRTRWAHNGLQALACVWRVAIR